VDGCGRSGSLGRIYEKVLSWPSDQSEHTRVRNPPSPPHSTSESCNAYEAHTDERTQ
jgi:hypothetical protein